MGGFLNKWEIENKLANGTKISFFLIKVVKKSRARKSSSRLCVSRGMGFMLHVLQLALSKLIK